MHKIKQVPEDFIVKEVSNVKISDKGDFSYVLLKKRNYATLRAIEHIAAKLGIDAKRISFAGTKDKNAVTEQLISIKSKDIEKIKNIELKDIELGFKGYGDKPISLGDLEGNEFEITVRNLGFFDDFHKKERFLNLFGEQRFSTNNAEVGKAVVKKDFKKAIELILVDERDYKKVIEEWIEKNPNDYIGALGKLPRKMLMMYINSYQSLLWNKTALKLKGEENIEVPIIGFGTDIDEIKDEKLKLIIKDIMQEEKLNERDFIIRELQNLSREGGERELFAEIRDLTIIEKSDDELNKGKKKIRLSFFLKKGCYATEAIKAMFKAK